MEIVHERCCGLDVHKKTVVACLMVPDEQGKVQKTIRTFGTMTAELLGLADWLVQAGCTHVAKESTGGYWKPIYNLLEGQLEVLVVNAQHLKGITGRKTDVRDAEWIADLLRHGLVRGSFIPSAQQREWRELTRYRASLIQERARIANRLQKVLEETNIKLASVATDILGVSARAMLEALLDGETDSAVLAGLARGRLREKQAELQQALQGKLKAHHVFLLSEHLAHIDYLDEAIARVSQQIEARLRPFEQDLIRLDSIPGINRRTAEVLLAEVGPDLSRFPSAKHLASWAGMCPGNHESAGKRLSGKTRKGSPWLRQALIEAAHGAARTKHSYLGEQYRRLAKRKGCQKAFVAVGHSLLVITYHLLTRQQVYRELGANSFDERQPQSVEQRLVARLRRLGYQVTLPPAA